jgi:hypothetical protein
MYVLFWLTEPPFELLMEKTQQTPKLERKVHFKKLLFLKN